MSFHSRCGRLLLVGLCAAFSHGVAEPAAGPASKSSAKAAAQAAANAQTIAALSQVTQSNQDLIDLLKKQQSVLEDIQYDRRLQNRQISSLEERLEETMQQNADLQAKVAKLEAELAAPAAPAGTTLTPAIDVTAKLISPPAPTAPATYLPAPESEGAPGTKSWHRLFTLSGTDGKSSDIFHIESHQWRVLWHNQDRPGAAYANTSALFINAFAKNDTVPQKVCSKLGSGGDSTELTGPGDFYLKIEASGGAWELAVEDFK
jgi:TolA-binding protein